LVTPGTLPDGPILGLSEEVFSNGTTPETAGDFSKESSPEFCTTFFTEFSEEFPMPEFSEEFSTTFFDATDTPAPCWLL
jgi:hypothetical protein